MSLRGNLIARSRMFGALCVMVVVLLVRLTRSWDIAVTAGDRLEFYTDNGTKIETVRFTSQNLTALAYDEVHNMLLYVDKQNNNDAICGYNMTSVEYKCYIERNRRNVQGLAFDPVTETLFFTDTKERSINWYSFKHGSKNNVYGNLLIKMDTGIPTDIAVDSCRGYVYWINTNLPRSTIERARFDGSDREVVIYAENKDLHYIHSVAIDQQIQKLVWLMPETRADSTYSADLNGKDSKAIIGWKISLYNMQPNSYTFSKHYFYAVGCTSCPKKNVWKHWKSNYEYTKIAEIHTADAVAIAANYKMKDQFQGISDCGHVLNNYETDGSFKIAKEYEGPFCVHGTKVNGQSLCKCTPGYTGDRCEVSVCENYCVQGNCSFSGQGHPACRCEAGYYGERCEVNVCTDHCLNNGTCSLDDDSQPICQCHGDYVGHRCEISGCQNYSLKGNCSFTEQGHPLCRCEAGYSGERCEVNACNGLCLNSGTCSLNEEDEPICDCVGEYEGDRCEVPKSLNNGGGSLNKGNQPACQCVGSHECSGRETNKNQTISTSPLNCLEESEKSLTLADLLANWRQCNNINK